MKKGFLFLGFLGVFLHSLNGYGGTNLASSKDPSVSQSYKTIVIYVRSDLAHRQVAEQKIIKELSKWSNARVIPSLDLFPVVKTYSKSEIQKALQDNGVDGLIIAQITNSQNYQTVMDIPTYQTVFGNVGGYSTTLSVPTTTSIPMSYTVWNSKIQFFDFTSGKQVWYAEGVTDGLTENGMMNNLIKKAVSILLDDGLIDRDTTSLKRSYRGY
ncbi:MAG: hypothetical protein U1F57_09215 [bacterium]